MDSRKQFEEKVLGPLGIDTARYEYGMCVDQYANLEAAHLWYSWRLSRKSIDIDLPKIEYVSQGFRSKSFNDCLDECKTAIQDAGLTTK